jgi:N-acetylmuramoyl-L-alanine amidase
MLRMAKASDYLIALDDGHGKNTPGKRTPFIAQLGREIQENEFNKAVVNYANSELKRCGFRTLLVAPTDADTSLQARTDLANSKKAHAYVSVHFDAFDGKFNGNDPEGFTIYVYPGHKNKPAGNLAKDVHGFIKQGTKQQDRGIKEANFHVLRATNMPAILIECGFMDNLREALLMVNDQFRREVAREIAQGICKYFKVPYKAATATKPAKASGKDRLYRVQAGAFTHKANAEGLKADLAKKGFKDSIVTKIGKYYKVQLGAFSVRKNADNLISQLKKAGFPAIVV